MISDETKKAPAIRFQGFSDAWEQRKLNDLALFNPKSILPEEFEYVDLESVSGTTMVSHRTETNGNAPSRAQRLAIKGDVFYQTVRPYQKNNYLFDLPYDNYVFSTGYAQLRPYGDSYFLLSRLQEKRFVLNVLDRSTGTSYPAINSNDLAQIEINVPSQTEEQSKIGAFFKHLDNTIALHQRKLTLFKQLKQAYLQALFPQSEEKNPSFRFAGFSEPWEQRKLGELLSEVKRPIKMADDEYYELVTVKRRNEGIVSRGIYRGKDVLVKSQFQIKTGDYLISKRQVVHGANGIVPKTLNNAIVSNEYLVSIGNKNITADFLSIISRLPDMYRKFFLSSYGIDIEKLVFNVEDWKKRTVRVPDVSEQNQISLFFKQLDNTIALHQSNLQKFAELKKVLLAKMFV